MRTPIEPKTRLVRIPLFFYAKLLDQAVREETNVHALVTEAVKQYLGKLEGVVADD